MIIDIAAVLDEIDAIGNEHSPLLEDFLKATPEERRKTRNDPNRVGGLAAICSSLCVAEDELLEVSDRAVRQMARTAAVFAASEGSVDLESMLKAMFLRAFCAGIRYQEKRDEDEPTP